MQLLDFDGRDAVDLERANAFIDWAMRTIAERAKQEADKLVAEMMIRVNNAWGKLLDDHGIPAIYRVQSSGRVRMTTAAAPHEGLGIGHYIWASSPLRRYVDLVNQWQLVALLRGEPPPFERNAETLLAAVHEIGRAHV